MKKLAILAALAAIIAAYFVLDLGQYLTLAGIKAGVAEWEAFYAAHPAAVIAGFFAVYVAVTAASLPGAALMTLAAGALFGVMTGTIIVSFASTRGATLAFLSSRYVLRDSIEARFGERLKAINAGVERDGAFYLFTLRMIPAFPFFVVNLVMGLTRIRTSTYMWVSQAGMLLGTVVYVNAGTQLARIESLSGIASPGVLGSFVLLGIAPWLARLVIGALQRRKAYSGFKRPRKFDRNMVVIGAGAAGLVSAYIAATVKAKVTLVEAKDMGGDCLNTGCVPSTALLAAGKAAQAMRSGAAFGIAPVEPTIDFAAVKDHVTGIIASIAPHDSQERFEGLGVTVLRDYARFTSPREVQAGQTLIRARRFVIATGSHAAIPPIPGIEDVPYLTNETIFALRDRPDHLLILGGGPIGMEMAQAHRRLGCRVTVIEAVRALGRDDPDCAAVVLASLHAEGVEIIEGQAVVRLRRLPEGIEAVLADGLVLTGSHLLIAAGRKPAIERLNLEAGGITHSRTGITVGANLRSVSNRRVYAMGDVAGGLQFTHVAAAHAGVLIRQILLGLPAKAASSAPWVTYTEPELAQVGLSEAEARAAHGDHVTVLRAEFGGNDRAIAERKGKGLVKVMVVKGRPVGASIVGPQAGELIGFWALAIATRVKLGTLAGLVLPYPTLGETAKRASGAYFSAKLFDNPALKRVVRLVQRFVP